MAFRNYRLTLLFALGVGLAHYFALTYLWGYISIHSPIPSWLDSSTHSAISREVIMFVCDVLTTAVLSIPAALLLSALRPRNLPLYLAIATVPSFIWTYRYVPLSPMPVGLTAFIPGILMYATILPIVAGIIRQTTREGNA